VLNVTTGLMRLGRVKSAQSIAAEAMVQIAQFGDVPIMFKARRALSHCVALEGDFELCQKLTEVIYAPLL